MQRKPPPLLKTLSTCFLLGIFAFLICCSFELVLNHLFLGKLRLTKLLAYLAIHVFIGLAYGGTIGAVYCLLGRFTKEKFSLRPQALFTALNISGFLGLFAFLVLNAHYLSNSSFFSFNSLALDAVLVLFCALLLLLSYFLANKANTSSTLFRTASILSSMAAAFVIFHALISRYLGVNVIGPFHAAALLFCYFLTGSAVVIVETQAIGMVARITPAGAEELLFKKFLWMKFGGLAIVVVVVAGVLFRNRYEPVIAENRAFASTARETDKPNIILIVLDTVRQDHLSLYGYERDTSPNIDLLAKQSWTFDAYSTSSWTFPAHATIMTGLYPTESGTGPDTTGLFDPRNKALAEILGDNGYSTAAIVSNHISLDQHSGFAQGFDYYYANSRETPLAFPMLGSFFFLRFFPKSPLAQTAYFHHAEKINNEAMYWLRKNGRAPFFLFVNYMDAHTPYISPRSYARRWTAKPPAQEILSLDDTGATAEIQKEREFLLGRYDGAIAYLDAQIGIFLRELREMGVFDNSLIILVSDHGEFFFEHDLSGHAQALYQEVVRIPLIVKPPADRMEKPGWSHRPVSLVDLFHSILEYIGIPHESRRGNNSLFKGGYSSIFCEFHLHENDDSKSAIRFGPHIRALIRNNYKLIHSTKKQYEFYDLSKDPLENHDLMAEPLPRNVEIRRAQMKADITSLVDQIDKRKLVPAQLPLEKRDEILTGLRALGYIQ
jgi:arylsulfatase A-like enzyme